MEIRRFTDEYELAAPLYNTSPEELQGGDAGQTQPVHRWLALSNGEAILAVSCWLRPDDRLFLSFAGSDAAAYGPLATVAADDLSQVLHTVVDASEIATMAALESAGFGTEVTSEAFRIRFSEALAWVRRAWVPRGLSVLPADELDEDRLFALDNTLRQDVPGTDGWRGDRGWFQKELREAPPFDPSAYLVGTDETSGDYVGLVRIWHNQSGPRLGLIGVTRSYRNTVIAAALLKQALTASAAWGYDTFTTETSTVNTVIYPRMQRLGAESLGRFLQMVRR